MTIRQNIDSWVTIDGQQAYIVYKGQLFSCKHCKEQAHSGISCVQNKKLLVQKSYANVAKQSGTHQPLKKNDRYQAIDPQTSRSTTYHTALGCLSELPKPTSQNEQSGEADQPENIDRMTSPIPQTQTVSSFPPSTQTQLQSKEKAKPSDGLVDTFKIPGVATRSQSKNSNGNETDESSASTSSRRSRRRPPGKKLRLDEGDAEQEEEQQV